FKLSLDELKNLQEIISAVETVQSKKFNDLYSFLLKEKTIFALADSKYSVCLDQLRKELQRLMQEFEKNTEIFNDLDLIFYNLESDYNIKSAIANKISLLNPNKTLIILESWNERTHFSARRQDFKVKMNDLLEQSIQGIPESSAGGHIPAAAGGIPTNQLKQFKENVKNYLKKNYKK
ncbi:MAG: DHH family phosphoesterase, partial [Candidatus Diapherotrites archaeon]|nr:DHH family phosphoesterase [Candidatus Diapherotrites archaeon]